MQCRRHTARSLIIVQREASRPLSNPHYIAANVGDEDVQVIKRHHALSLDAKRNTLGGIARDLEDKCKGQRRTSIFAAAAAVS